MVETQVDTSLAKQYLFKLCKHFARKIRVDFDTEHGVAYFDFGELQLAASENQLRLRLCAQEAAQLEILKSVVEHHLQLMTRSTDPALPWQVVGDAPIIAD
ncbi:DUF2218 domain-containing protein [Chitinibacter sp. GC72]|uniref:DUF2218 domain-containing protein n=1 Tax=Chitinibacter sp. GC72 TaxID=1526917 RepID=UPI0018DF4C87|nr:DUF2218 domain-containing protein [Chitinibacter sp. GC72]